MEKATPNADFHFDQLWRSSCLLWLLCLSQLTNAQTSQRPRDPIGDPTTPCSFVYSQGSGATYAAANHLSGTFGAADIGANGVTTTIDVGLYYGGTVVFSGVYHVRGNVRFTNGTVDLRPGTAFVVEGLSGQSLPSSNYPTFTVIEVENAILELTGAAILSTCPQAWGGINLLDYGRIRTRADAAATAPAGRSTIRDAHIAVNVAASASGRSTGEYYLNDTDFLNNQMGVYDHCKNVARAGEGVHYCTFSTDSGLKAPIATPTGNLATTGVRLSFSDQALGYNNYAAASIDHSSFHHLDTGIFGTGQQLRVMDNTFDHNWYAAIDLETNNGAGFFSWTHVRAAQ